MIGKRSPNWSNKFFSLANLIVEMPDWCIPLSLKDVRHSDECLTIVPIEKVSLSSIDKKNCNVLQITGYSPPGFFVTGFDRRKGLSALENNG
jgi:hypothetical protein